MKLHEHQAKDILKRYGIAVPEGRAVSTADDAAAVAASLDGDEFVVKAQVLAGGRGKAGGIKSAKGADGVHKAASAILGMRLVSKQTGPEGKIVSKVLVEKSVGISRELYLGMLIDRERDSVVIIGSSEGGMEIEEIAARNPQKIIKEYVDPLSGLMPFQCRAMGYALGLAAAEVSRFAKVVSGCHRAFVENDLSLMEINPLVITQGGDFVALDAKVIADDNGLFRHKTVAELKDESDEDPREVEASRHGLNYIGLEGSIGCLVNGAGLAMATMDIIKYYGAMPANFLDIGGGATAEAISAGFKIILSDPQVRAILVNIFGGIVRCDLVAQSVTAAAREVGVKVPLIVRLEGTNRDLGQQVLKDSGLSIIPAATMDEAARKAVEAC